MPTGLGSRAEQAGKILLAGFVGGVAGAWAMRRFSALWRGLGGPSSAPRGEPYSSQEWDSAGRAAERITSVLLARRLSVQEKRRATAALHYLVGGAAGAGYAATSNAYPAARVGSGTVFGTAFWLLGDELSMPWLGLTDKPSDYSLAAHVNSLGEHIVYGMTTESVRRAALFFLCHG